MEKMNQVSVSEFMSKSKEEMYDMAVEMVEKYNRLVDICNDSAERIAELIVRHKVYTDALKNDIASKDAKIEKLEKEIEGRKECYTALKELMDTKYISIEDHNNSVDLLNKEIERLNIYTANQKKVNHDLVTKVTLLESELADCKVKNRHQRENLDGVNRTLEIRTKEKESLVKVRNNLNKEIEAHEAENKRLTEKITSLKGTISELSHDIDDYKSWNASLHKDIKELKKNKEDDYGKSGFKRYIEHLIEEEEGKFKGELNKRFSEEVSKISQKRTEEALAKVKLNEKFGVGGVVDEFKEETEAKGVGRTNSGRYPWGAKVNNIPCGEDAIE